MIVAAVASSLAFTAPGMRMPAPATARATDARLMFGGGGGGDGEDGGGFMCAQFASDHIELMTQHARRA